MEEKDYRTIVNPTYYTAMTTLNMLDMAGYESAKMYVKELNIHEPVKELFDEKYMGVVKSFTEDELKIVHANAILSIETRYVAIGKALKDSKIKNFFDVACGYTPKSLECSKNGIDYVGFDVPIVVEAMNKVAEKFGLNKKHPAYIGGDATNSKSLLNAADNLSGELFISCEGLIPYFSKDELFEMMECLI